MKGLSVRIDRQLAAFELSVELDVSAGIVALFGRSGVGKSQTLECIAGLARPDRGEIRFDGEPLFQNLPGRPKVDLPPRKRRVGYVVQDGALFPHRSLLDNVAYPLRGPSRRATAAALLDEMGIAHFGDELPHMVSGGQRRRAAIARALASQPRLLLLDEPLVHLDRLVRNKLIADLRRTVRDRGIPALLVTHDIGVLARTADRVAVMEDGRIVQHGSLQEVLFHPASGGIARLFGDVNLVDGVVVGPRAGAWRVETGPVEWQVPFLGALEPGTEVEVMIRAGGVKLLRQGVPVPPELQANRQNARLVSVEPRPDVVWLCLELAGGLTLTALVTTDRVRRAGIQEGADCEIGVVLDAITLFEKKPS